MRALVFSCMWGLQVWGPENQKNVVERTWALVMIALLGVVCGMLCQPQLARQYAWIGVTALFTIYFASGLLIYAFREVEARSHG